MSRPATALPNWAWLLGQAGASGVIRRSPEDFRVQELPLVQPEGEGNHLWLEIEKRGANTNWVADQLARSAGVKSRDVGFAGMKDRHGVTSQWFSVGLQEAASDDWMSWAIKDVTVLQAQRHGRKLRRGALAGNRFHIVVRELRGETGDLLERIEKVDLLGVPNYFGLQRFGHGGLNVQRARDWLERGGRIRRNQRGIYLSSARSYLFNQVLSARVDQGNWNHLLDGDLAMLDGSRSVFPCTLPDPVLLQRCAEFDIHPTGPLPGRGQAGTQREAATLETAVLEADGKLVEALAAAGVDAARRSLRLRPRRLECELDGDVLSLKFELPAGAYATSLLRELVTVSDGALLKRAG
ncbi:MAG: tRNA pseudouridine(13) synthase TruD [Xanthomonadales bacterium]|jgi:tRNA pseudouridine13 synthase|nr:tRNA pseudouridine(13) synthase TruD [Xanthomonadales bacterium]